MPVLDLDKPNLRSTFLNSPVQKFSPRHEIIICYSTFYKTMLIGTNYISTSFIKMFICNNLEGNVETNFDKEDSVRENHVKMRKRN